MELKVIELFAGVGGFRIGLEGYNGKSSTSNFKENFKSPFKVIWSNQWEPSTKTQHASIVYDKNWTEGIHINENIEEVVKDCSKIPDADILVGGFPCQDYSVATTLKNSKGLEGKKGVLWWSIHRILEEKKTKPKVLFLENVDRLISSPSKQKGRDFAIILKTLNDLDYIVEWRIINASDYGFPQKRKRTFILAYHKNSKIFNSIKKSTIDEWILENGTIASAFECNIKYGEKFKHFDINYDLLEVSEKFNLGGKTSPFENTGMIIDGKVTTVKTEALYEGKNTLLKDILLDNKNIDKDYFIENEDIDKWKYLKGAKKEVRKNSDGYEYNYSEGGMTFPDDLNKPSRTIITGEGGKSPSRFKHVIQTDLGLRRLTPIELERLNMFPDNHTEFENISDTKRAFFMGNALVIGVIEKIGIEIAKKLQE